MATQKRSSSGKRTTTGKKTTAGGRRATAPKKRPIRREVGGVVCLVLALCIAFSYFQQGGWLLDQPAALCRGLVGYGYYTVAPVLLLVSYILLFHRGRNVTACVVGAVLLPVEERKEPRWRIPRHKVGVSVPFGFGQANIWYASEPEADTFVKRIAAQIHAYRKR
mgnify:CR=1 FL=1